MKIEHLALWSDNIDRLKDFYTQYFHALAGEKYVNPVKQFESYFLEFESGARLEVMKMPGIQEAPKHLPHLGIAHFAISVGSKETVDDLTGRLRKDGFRIIGEPRTTGDGYYESVVLDPDGNRIEITV